MEVMQLGKGSLIAKIDIKSAYRLVPVSPLDHHYLGMQWNGQIYVDGMLPFGLRSAPNIFNAIADALDVWLRKEYRTYSTTWMILPFWPSKLGAMQLEPSHFAENLRGPRHTTGSRETSWSMYNNRIPRHHHRHHRSRTSSPR